MSPICPRDVIAEAIQSDSGRYRIVCGFAGPDEYRSLIAGPRAIAEHVLDALAGEGYAVVPASEWDRLSDTERTA